MLKLKMEGRLANMSFNAKFFELVKKYEQLKEQYKEVSRELNSVMKEIGVGSYLQDSSDMVVYKIVEPEGTFVEFKKIGYERTLREGEKRGTLSKKEAEEKGFNLGK